MLCLPSSKQLTPVPGSISDEIKRDPAGRSLVDGHAEDLAWREARRREWEARLARTDARFKQVTCGMGVFALLMVGTGLAWAVLSVGADLSTLFPISTWVRIGPLAYVAAMALGGLGLFIHWIGAKACERLRAAAVRDGVTLTPGHHPASPDRVSPTQGPAGPITEEGSGLLS